MLDKNSAWAHTETVNPTELGRAFQALRKTRGPGTGRPRTVPHEPGSPRCPCADCRKARGAWPGMRKPKNTP